MASVGVIGAGLAGLTAAYRLARAGVDVTVHEADLRFGGVVRSIASDGYLVELGPSTMAAPAPAAASLLSEVGLDGLRIAVGPLARHRYIVRQSRLVPLPTSPAAALTTPLLSPLGKLRILREPFVRASNPAGEESVADFVRRRFGAEVLEYVANPFVAGIYAGDPERLSARHALPQLYAMEQRYGSLIRAAVRRRTEGAGGEGRRGELWSFSGGLQAVPEALARGLGDAIRLGSRVRAVGREGRRWMLRAGAAGFGAIERYDAVIHAGTAHGLVNLALDIDRGERLAGLLDVPHPPVAVVALGFSRDDVAHPLDGFGMLVPAREGRNILGVVFSSSLFPDRAPAGQVLLTVFVGGARDPRAALADSATMLERILADLRLLLGVRGAPTFDRRIVWAQAIPQYVVGYAAHLHALAAVERDNRGLLFAGSYRDGIAVGDVIASGMGAADRVIALLGGDSGR